MAPPRTPKRRPSAKSPRSHGPRSEHPRSERPRTEAPHAHGPRSKRPHSPTQRPESRPDSQRPKSPRHDSPRSDDQRSERPRSRGQKPMRPSEQRRQRAAESYADLQRVAGHAAVQALFERSRDRVQRLFFDEESKPLVGEWCSFLANAHRPYRMVPADELAKVAGTPMHGGIVALATPKPIELLDAYAARRWATDGKLLLVLDGIGNPQNLGAIARTAAFFGVTRMVLSDNPAQAAPSDAAYRIAEGGLDRIDLYRSGSFLRDLRTLRETYLIVGTAAVRGDSLATLRRDKRPVALVLGNEERGLPPATFSACEAVVTLAGQGAVQSLNVSATAAILIHALVSQAR